VGNEIIINVEPFETRVAVLENRSINEIFIERTTQRRIAGNIYRGRVTKVLPGMQVAFVDIGLEKSGFLHKNDISPSEYGFVPDFSKSPEHEEPDEDDLAEDHVMEAQEIPPIEEILQEGQEIMVQVIKDPIGTKGTRISTFITLPGRYLVFMPLVDHVGISRRIEDPAERDRLKAVVDSIRNPAQGFIIRTAAEGAAEEDLKRDVDFLERMWEKTLAKNERVKAPSLIHGDLDIVLRSLRDLCGKDVEKVIIDSEEDHHRCEEFMNNFIGDPKPPVELYKGSEPIFESYAVEIEIERALGKKVWLKSGGYIVIDQTEALTTIDVNTGKFVGKRSQEETILKTNLEAVKEIVYQLRLRNLGGIIIIDFIDMEKEVSKEKVYLALEQALKPDRARATILRVSELGLVEMTRKRTRESLTKTLCMPCPHCDGKGFVKSPKTICHEIFREIERVVRKKPDASALQITVSQRIATALYEEGNNYLEKLESERNFNFTINVDVDVPDEEYEVAALD
jgi:ribonuclease G